MMIHDGDFDCRARWAAVLSVACTLYNLNHRTLYHPSIQDLHASPSISHSFNLYLHKCTTSKCHTNAPQSTPSQSGLYLLIFRIFSP